MKTNLGIARALSTAAMQAVAPQCRRVEIVVPLLKLTTTHVLKELIELCSVAGIHSTEDGFRGGEVGCSRVSGRKFGGLQYHVDMFKVIVQ